MYIHLESTFFSSLTIRFLLAVHISSSLLNTKLSYLTSSLGLGNSLNFTVFIIEFENFYAKLLAASISS